MTKLSEEIFRSTSLLRSAYETQTPTWLFCCSAGLLRSPTAARVAQQLYDVNTRSCGVHHWALIPFTYDLAFWADKIIFMDKACYNDVEQAYSYEKQWDKVSHKCVAWNVPDKYEYMDCELVEIIAKNLQLLQS
jgi:predicted protein tyrosine phosphatase